MKTLQFKRWKFTSDLAPSAVLTLKNECGIYVLEFANGEQYVGQTIHFPTRLAKHRRTYPDIIAINFSEVAAPDLNMAEYGEIQRRRRSGILLRNKTLLAQPLGDSPLDNLIDQQEQAAWLDVVATDDEEIHIGDRAEVARGRTQSDKKFDELQQQPHFEEALNSLAAYVAYVIPYPHLTENKTWTVTAMPATNRRSTDKRVAALSVNNVEMMYLRLVRDDEDGEWVPLTTLNVADTYQPPLYMHDFVYPVSYRSAGPIKAISMDGFFIKEFLMDDAILLAARELALGQMRKGTTMFSKYHNDALSDAIFERIDQWIEENKELH
ncbi:GIY-YIG nuclease family protein [uncultured Corynebacterium sp.]|uniref:GIY-YIG nuclease family protein n=1 Tax=uncultured Corynebacterium sp. TaxID=159447 RepID=UPI0025ECA73A|nr:GIY-YIG nuclease family protein [uncultured Corynebacterium sp.]